MKALTMTERKKLRNSVGNETLKATLKMLEQHGKCMVIRPTGFGKSYMLARLTGKYTRSLYVYPTDIIKLAVQADYGAGKGNKVELENTEFISYSALNNKYKDGTVKDYLKKFKLVMLDECHMAGANGFMAIYKAVYDIFEAEKVHLIGVTATPNRVNKTQIDGEEESIVNVLYDIFDGHKIFPFSLKNCFQTGLMLKPRYVEIVYNTKDFKASVGKRIDKYKSRVEKSNATDSMREENNRLITELAKMIDNIDNAPTQIKKVIEDERGKHVNYLKFITFCRNRADISDRQSRISAWFKEAYPDYDVVDHIIVSKGAGTENLDYEDEIKSVDELAKIEERSNTIDLIYCVDMLNMGYHIDNIDGILMMRSTQSQIVYLQQIGRCMSVTGNKRPIIFDFVKNIGMNFFKDNDKSEVIDESGELIDVDKEEADDMILSKADLFISSLEDGTGALLSKIDEAMANILNPEDRLMNQIVWWYTEMKAPIYIILKVIGKPLAQPNINNIIKILNNNGIEIEDESRCVATLSSKQLDSIKGKQEYLDCIDKSVSKLGGR